MLHFLSRVRNIHGSMPRKAPSRRGRRAFPPWDGQLEARRLLAIVWSNRATTDNFGVFGADTATARSVVDQAVTYWNSYLNIDTTFSLDVIITATTGNGASTNITG